MELRRTMFVDAISSTSVQLRRDPRVSASNEADPGLVIHQANLITGNATASNAATSFWQTGCVAYEMIIRRLS